MADMSHGGGRTVIPRSGSLPNPAIGTNRHPRLWRSRIAGPSPSYPRTCPMCRRCLAGLACLAVLVATACSSLGAGGDASVRRDGPVQAGGGAGSMCVPIGNHRQASIAFDTLRTSEDVVLHGVELDNADGLGMVESYVVPAPVTILPGVEGGWPPTDTDQTPEWERRVELSGARVEGSDRHWLLVLRVDVARKPATMDSVTISYAVGDTAYEATTSTSIELRGGSSCH